MESDRLPPAPPPTFASFQILVIEDDLVLADTLAELLSSDGHNVTVAHGYRAGLEAIGKGRIDLVFADLEFRGGSWTDIAARIQEAQPGVPLILVSGWPERLPAERIKRFGVEAVLEKPFGSVELRRAVARVMGRRYIEARETARREAEQGRPRA